MIIVLSDWKLIFEMIIYNVTIKVEHSIAAEWIEWLRSEHIPEIIQTGCFYDAVIYHLLDTDEADGITYAVQYHATDHDAYKKYLQDYAAAMRKKSTDKWQNKFVAFRSVLELVH